MKKLFILANIIHASPRIPSLLSELIKDGWRITILTTPIAREDLIKIGLTESLINSVQIVEAPYSGDVFTSLRKIMMLFDFKDDNSFTEQLKDRISLGGSGGSPRSRKLVDFAMRQYQAIFAFPDTEWPWMRSALRVADKILTEEPYDILLSSSPFPTVHCISSKLKKKYNIKWVADFRDPWCKSHNYSLPKWRYFLDYWLEKKIISSADLITTVSEGFAKKLRSMHPVKVSVVRNGYQPIWDGPVSQITDKLTILYTGTIYDGKQNPKIILSALRELFDAGKVPPNGVRLNFYGRHDSKLQALIDELDLNDVVFQLGLISRGEARKLQREAHILLVLQWEDLAEEGIFPLKFYEYLSSGRIAIATGGSDQSELSHILRETGAGYSAPSVEECRSLIENFYQNFIRTGELSYGGNISKIEEYSYENSSKVLLQILNEQLI